MTDAQRTFFQSTAESLGFTAAVHPNNPSGYYWHLAM